jgi:hypothetical protein
VLTNRNRGKMAANGQTSRFSLSAGLCFRLHDLLHLLRIYQGVIHARPIEMGNREFLECLIISSRKIFEVIPRAPRTVAPTHALTKKLRYLLKAQNTSNAKDIACQILCALDNFGGSSAEYRNSEFLYIRQKLLPLRTDYHTINVIFGPALGLGDQIAFFFLLQRLRKYCSRSQLTIFTLYPNLWRHLLPDVREVTYRGSPLRPFDAFQRNHRKRKPTRELVLIADFDCFNLHARVIPKSSSRDILEISLGRQAAWYYRCGSPWIRFEDFSQSQPSENNYCVLSKMSERLMPQQGILTPWEAICSVPPTSMVAGKKVILLNPFTSKDYSLKSTDWYHLLRKIQTLVPKQISLKVKVFPGLNEESRLHANEIVTLCRRGLKSLRAEVLGAERGKLLTAYNAFLRLAEVLRSVDVCLTVDTFTAHLAPLHGVTTVVVTHRNNRAFWVPSPWSFYCLKERMQIVLPPLLTSLLTIEHVTRGLLPLQRTAARKLVACTNSAAVSGISKTALRKIINALSVCVRSQPQNFPFSSQAKQWLLIWSRLAAGMHREPLEMSALTPYWFRWKDSEFYKLLYLSSRQRRRAGAGNHRHSVLEGRRQPINLEPVAHPSA